MNRLFTLVVIAWAVSSNAFACPPHAPQPAPDATWTYKQVNGKDLTLSVYLPDDYKADKSFPTIVIFHGGSWRAGDPSWHYPDCEYWSRRGMIAVSVDYRLKDRDNVEVPLACVKDAKSAIRFLRGNAARLKVKPDAIVAAGGSAGGQLAAALATISSDRSNETTDDVSISCKPNAVVLWNPRFKCKPELSPPQHIHPGLPPFITFLGDQDPAIPVEELKSFHDALTKAGTVSVFYIGKGGKHGFCNGRNQKNHFFYWSLELTDKFLVKQGMITGASQVQIPTGIKRLKADDFLTFESHGSKGK